MHDPWGDSFTDAEQATLAPFVTNLHRPIFGLRNLPEVVKGALFSRYSRTDKSLRRKDFVKAAEADGFAWARRLVDKAALESTVAEFLAFDGPAFLEVVVDPDAGVYPMVGPGASYAQMITGDFIASRTAVALDADESPVTSMF